MRQYRVYSLDIAGHIVSAQSVECRDDLEALEWAKLPAQRESLEVWDGSRLVARVKPENASLTAEDRYSL